MTNHAIDATVARLAPVQDADLRGAALSPAADALLARILAGEVHDTRRVARTPRVLIVGAAAAAAAAALVGVFVGTNRDQTASAATVLRDAGAVARQQPALVVRPGQFVYTRSRNVWTVTTVLHGKTITALEPHVREIWLGPTGGRLHEVTGEPTFLTPADRVTWVELGRPKITQPGESDVALDPEEPLTVPTDADALFTQLKRQSEGKGNGTYAEMFTLVGDALRETGASPAQRAALYEVAARIPGVVLLGSVRDPAGRLGTGVAFESTHNALRTTLIFDPATSALLAEQQVALRGGQAPAGTLLGYAVYLQQGVVDSSHGRP
jgi:hypothetical protein